MVGGLAGYMQGLQNQSYEKDQNLRKNLRQDDQLGLQMRQQDMNEQIGMQNVASVKQDMETQLQDRVIKIYNMFNDRIGGLAMIKDPVKYKQGLDYHYNSPMAKIIDPNKESYEFFSNQENARNILPQLQGHSALVKQGADRQKLAMSMMETQAKIDNYMNQAKNRDAGTQIDQEDLMYRKDKLAQDIDYGNQYLESLNKKNEIAQQGLGVQKEQQGLQKATTLRKELNPVMQDFNSFDTKMKQIDKLKENFASKKDLSGVEAYALIMNIGKLLDPSSVFREGEFATLASSGDAYQGLLKTVQGLVGDQKLATPEMVVDMFNLVDSLRGEVDDVFNGELARYGDLAEQYGVDPELVLGGNYGKMFKGETPQEQAQSSNGIEFLGFE